MWEQRAKGMPSVNISVELKLGADAEFGNWFPACEQSLSHGCSFGSSDA